jgi:hypothetical protein
MGALQFEHRLAAVIHRYGLPDEAEITTAVASVTVVMASAAA